MLENRISTNTEHDNIELLREAQKMLSDAETAFIDAYCAAQVISDAVCRPDELSDDREMSGETVRGIQVWQRLFTEHFGTIAGEMGAMAIKINKAIEPKKFSLLDAKKIRQPISEN